MKKPIKKLQLSKSTISNLTMVELMRRVAGNQTNGGCPTKKSCSGNTINCTNYTCKNDYTCKNNC